MPEVSQLSDQLDEFFQIDRLDHESINLQQLTTNQILVSFGCRQDHNRHLLELELGTNRREYFSTIKFGKMQIK